MPPTWRVCGGRWYVLYGGTALPMALNFESPDGGGSLPSAEGPSKSASASLRQGADTPVPVPVPVPDLSGDGDGTPVPRRTPTVTDPRPSRPCQSPPGRPRLGFAGDGDAPPSPVSIGGSAPCRASGFTRAHVTGPARGTVTERSSCARLGTTGTGLNLKARPGLRLTEAHRIESSLRDGQ